MGIFDSFRKKRHEEKLGEVRPQVHPKTESATAIGWQVGDRIGESYVVLRILGGPGRSGMGIVYVCYDHELHRPLALKTFQDRFLSDKAIVDRFKWEAEAWTRLGRHQNIVWAVCVEVIQGRPFVALEYVSGDEAYGADLSGWIKCGGLRQNDKLDIPLILNFSLQFCHGMMHAKKKFQEIGRPFVHRDVKPSNIMVT
jgi:serine/threonine protein kinase